MGMLAHSENRHYHLEGDVSTHISCRWLTQPRRYAPAEGQAGVMERELKSNPKQKDQQLLVNTTEVGNECGVSHSSSPYSGAVSKMLVNIRLVPKNSWCHSGENRGV